jgi:hypothetical protein
MKAAIDRRNAPLHLSLLMLMPMKVFTVAEAAAVFAAVLAEAGFAAVSSIVVLASIRML